MKKLRLYDHNDKLIKEFDVYVDGQSFSWRSPEPTAIWLGTIALQDVEEEVPAVPEVEQEPEPEPIIDFAEGFQRAIDYYGIWSGWLGNIKLGEVKHEPEKPDNQGNGDGGTRPAEQPESPEKLSKKPARRNGHGRDSRTRKRKAPESPLGSGTEGTVSDSDS